MDNIFDLIEEGLNFELPDSRAFRITVFAAFVTLSWIGYNFYQRRLARIGQIDAERRAAHQLEVQEAIDRENRWEEIQALLRNNR